MLRILWKWLAATFSIIVILLAVGIGLFRLMLPLVPQYHERIETFASDAAGTPVRIERIDARWGLHGPELRFHNAQFLTNDGREALLSAETGSVILDLGVLVRKFQFRAGRVLLDGLRLEVVRDINGQWQIGGRKFEQNGGAMPTQLAIGLRKAQIVFRDEPSQVGPWVLDDVDLNVELRDQHLSIDAIINLPPELGGEIEVSLEADSDFKSWETSSFQAYVRGADLVLNPWSKLMPKTKTIPTGGNGDVLLWVAMHGKTLQQASAQLDLRQVTLAKNAVPSRSLDLVKGRIDFGRNAAGWEASGQDISLVSDGVAWPTTSFEIEQVGGENEAGLTYADLAYFRLQDLAPLADWLPDEKTRSWIERLQPRGVIENLSFRMTREQGQVDSYTLRSEFSDLGAEAVDDIPGFDTLRGNVRLDAFGGRLQLDPDNVVIDLPKIIGKPVTTQRMNGVVVWRKNASGWRVVSDNIDLDLPFLRTHTSLELTLPVDKSSPTLDLRVALSDVKVAALHALVPEPILKPDLSGWLKTAFVGGTVPAAEITWSGALDNFPFDDGVGVFKVDAELKDIELAYAKDWPVARGLTGTLSFHNAGFLAGLDAADLSGNLVSSASVSMADLRQGVLKLQVSADGMLTKLHEFLKATPVVESEDDPFARVEFSGFGTTEVDVTLPLKKLVDRDVSVTVSTESGEVALRGLDHRLEQIEGSLEFHNGEFSGKAITALILGAPAVIDVATDTQETDEGPRQVTVATARGQVSQQELARLHKSLPDVLRGGTSYTATATFPEKSAAMPVTVEVSSRLEGMAVTLPEPVAKPGSVAKNFLLTMSLPDGAAQTDIVYGDVGNARINWLRDDDKPWKLDRGGIELGAIPAILPGEPGLVINGSAQRLDVAGWLGLEVDGQSDARVPISSIRLNVARLDAFGQELSNAALGVDHNEREWLVQIDSPAVSGALFVPFNLQQQPIIANLERLYISAGSEEPGNTVADDADMDPREIPDIDIQADDFRLGEMKLGEMRAELRETSAGIGVTQFTSTATTFSVQGQGDWRIDQGLHRTTLEFKLLSNDVGTTLVDLDFDRSISAGDAELTFSVNWPGPPGPDFKKHLNGDVNVRVGAGQLQAVEPGAGRVFGLFSFTALPRRLSLDFRDVFDTGFGFDRIEGDFVLDDGNAFTSNLVLEGPAAQVGIAGRAGLVARDYDQTAVVYGNFGAALPVAGVLAGGPVGGAAMLIFSELFKKSLQDMARVNYRISGSWDEPAIERVLATSEGDS